VLRWHSLSESAVPARDDWLSAAEQQVVAGMRFAKRRFEWRLARWTAKQALARTLGTGTDLGALRRIEVRASLDPATRGAPFVIVDGEPAGLAVSLTDRAGWAVCALGAQGPIGCDLELDEPRSAAFVRDYLTVAEQRRVADPPTGLSPDAAANLVWSAKESALKVLRTGLRRDTRSVEVTLGQRTGGPAQHGWSPLEVADLDGGGVFPGWWRRFGVFLVTVAGAGELPAPVALDDPPALTTATPVHSWMADPVMRPARR
jgi:4'-phosphopantetheinyl transferase